MTAELCTAGPSVPQDLPVLQLFFGELAWSGRKAGLGWAGHQKYLKCAGVIHGTAPTRQPEIALLQANKPQELQDAGSPAGTTAPCTVVVASSRGDSALYAVQTRVLRSVRRRHRSDQLRHRLASDGSTTASAWRLHQRFSVVCSRSDSRTRGHCAMPGGPKYLAHFSYAV